MHLSMIIWFYKVPFGYRRKMNQKDIEYRNQLKLQTNSNGYIEKINNKDKFNLLNIIIKEDIKTKNDIIKDRIVHL